MSESGGINKTCGLHGQMNEPPGARMRVALAGLTTAEYFRDQGQDVLLFIDNIFRFSQAGSEVSALLGRMPSAVGYQPTLATEMGELQGALPPPRRAPLPRNRGPSTSPQTTLPTLPLPLPLRTWMQPRSSRVPSPSWAFTRPWTRWQARAPRSTRPSWVRSTIAWQ